MNTALPLSRRDFTGLGFTAGMGWLAGLGHARAQAVSPDYKALVCIYLAGGNDAHNTVIPRTPAEFNYYKAARGPLALPTVNAQSLLDIATANGTPYALHSNLPRLRALFNGTNAQLGRRLAIVANVGMLAAPTTRAQFQTKSGPLPTNLFSHADQTVQVQAGAHNIPNGTGWGGRLADVMKGANNSRPLSALTWENTAIFCNGTQVQAARMIPGNNLDQYALSYLGATDPRVAAQKVLASQTSELALVDEANKAIKQALEINPILKNATGLKLTTPFPKSRLGQQLDDVARIISLRGDLGVTRQVFFCQHFGFDTHGGQDWNHTVLLRELDDAMEAFYLAMVEMGLQNQVTSFTSSEFGRTLQPSGTGSDHGWGGHQFVLGGAVRGGDIYGTFPSLNLADPANPHFADNRGVLLPSTSTAQFGATLAKWFGTSPAELTTLFPTLGAFPTADLGFMA